MTVSQAEKKVFQKQIEIRTEMVGIYKDNTSVKQVDVVVDAGAWAAIYEMLCSERSNA